MWIQCFSISHIFPFTIVRGWDYTMCVCGVANEQYFVKYIKLFSTPGSRMYGYIFSTTLFYFKNYLYSL